MNKILMAIYIYVICMKNFGKPNNESLVEKAWKNHGFTMVKAWK